MHDFRDRLAKDGPQLGCAIMYPSPGIVERIGADWDWIWIDGQHGEMGYSDVLALVRACNLVKRPAVVRVAGHAAGPICKAMDTGAAGIIVPCVDTPQQARAIVQAAKFPPLGNRSFGSIRNASLYTRSYSEWANDRVLLIAQIESPQAIENVEEIAALPGIDALFLGPDDLLLRRGVSTTAPRNAEALGRDMETVSQACHRHKKLGVMVGVGEEMLSLAISMGFDLIVSGGDILFLAPGSKDAAAKAKAIRQRTFAATTGTAEAPIQPTSSSAY